MKIQTAILLISCISAMAQPPQYRVVNGKIYNVQKCGLWDSLPIGKIYEVRVDGLIVIIKQPDRKNPDGRITIFQHIFLKNYIDQTGNGFAKDQIIYAFAMRSGITNIIYNGNLETFEVWDCGSLTNTPPDEEIAAAKAQAIVEKKRLEEAKKAIEQAQVRTFIWLQPQATNGDASAQCSLGLHYLNGQGCETNREQAIYWLQKSAAQGYTEASNKLASFQK